MATSVPPSFVAPATAAAEIADYENRLKADRRWALSEGSRYFEGAGAVQGTLRKIARDLERLVIPYAIVGGLALFHHGLRQFTEVVTVLVTPEGLEELHRHLDGRGYVRPFEGSRNLKETEFGVRIEFLTTGGFPGDGKPKPVAFPDPEESFVESDGIRYIALPRLVELKLASGMSAPGRLKDLADVQELIRTLGLSETFAVQLDPSVAARFRELWRDVQVQEE